MPRPTVLPYAAIPSPSKQIQANPKQFQAGLAKRSFAPKFLKLMLNCCRAPALASQNTASVFHFHPALSRISAFYFTSARLTTPLLQTLFLLFPPHSSLTRSKPTNLHYPRLRDLSIFVPRLTARGCSLRRPKIQSAVLRWAHSSATLQIKLRRISVTELSYPWHSGPIPLVKVPSGWQMWAPFSTDLVQRPDASRQPSTDCMPYHFFTDSV